jgi:hypothetical protein
MAPAEVMPSPLRQLRSVWLITSWHGDERRHLGVCGTFKAAYAVSLFELRIAEPNLKERQAREHYRKSGSLLLWDRSRFEYEEEARFSPVGSGAEIQEIPVKKT